MDPNYKLGPKEETWEKGTKSRDQFSPRVPPERKGLWTMQGLLVAWNEVEWPGWGSDTLLLTRVEPRGQLGMAGLFIFSSKSPPSLE